MSGNITGHMGTDPNVFRDRTLLAGSVELFLFGVVLLSCCCLTFFCFCTSCACFVKHYIPPRDAVVTTESSIERPVQRDKPPPYDEVEDGLPTYQEAVRRLSLVTVNEVPPQLPPPLPAPPYSENNHTELTSNSPQPPEMVTTSATRCEIKNEKLKEATKSTTTTTCNS